MTREFLGVPGVVMIFVLCHLVLFAFYLNCAEAGCGNGVGLSWLLTTPVKIVSGGYTLYQHAGLQIYIVWLVWLLALFYLVPGQWVKGTQLRDGNTLDYKVNGERSYPVFLPSC
jgi:delta14-sterol reductase